MNSYSFYIYAALLFGLGLMEVATVAVYNAISFTGLGFSEGPGIVAYAPYSGALTYVANTNPGFKDHKERLIRVEDNICELVIRTLYVYGGPESDVNSKRFELLDEIDSFSYSNKDNSFVFPFKGQEVKIVFSEYVGCRNTAFIFSVAGIPFKEIPSK